MSAMKQNAVLLPIEVVVDCLLPTASREWMRMLAAALEKIVRREELAGLQQPLIGFNQLFGELEGRPGTEPLIKALMQRLFFCQ